MALKKGANDIVLFSCYKYKDNWFAWVLENNKIELIFDARQIKMYNL